MASEQDLAAHDAAYWRAQLPAFQTYAPAPAQRDAYLRDLEARIAALGARVDALERVPTHNRSPK